MNITPKSSAWPKVQPRWGKKETNASHTVYYHVGDLPDKPVYSADPLNLFVVVESGDHHVSILDGDTFKRLARFPSHYALHGGPRFPPHGHYVYFASRGDWITRYDLYNLKVTAEIRAGINTRNLAVSDDGRYVLVGNYLPQKLVLLNASDLSLAKIIPVVGENGQSSRVSAVYEAKPRHSFIIALKDVPEIVATLRPEPGKTTIHTEFTRDGRYALVSVWEMDGALAVYDARTLKLVKLIPMSKPVGKYNVYNKITLSPGTSH